MGQRTVLLRVEYSRPLLSLSTRVLDGGDAERWQRGQSVLPVGVGVGGELKGDGVKGGRTYQQVVPVGVGAIGQVGRQFVFEFTPGSDVGPVEIPTIGIILEEIGVPATEIRSAQLDVVVSEMGILFFELADAVRGTYFVVCETHCSLKPRNCLLELEK